MVTIDALLTIEELAEFTLATLSKALQFVKWQVAGNPRNLL